MVEILLKSLEQIHFGYQHIDRKLNPQTLTQFGQTLAQDLRMIMTLRGRARQ